MDVTAKSTKRTSLCEDTGPGPQAGGEAEEEGRELSRAQPLASPTGSAWA